jgi:hypothetical protein
MKRSIIILVVLQVVVINLALAQKPAIVTSDKAGWHKIGEVTASFKTETESIAVLGADRFKAIKLKATDAPINIDRVTVTYESGEMQEIPVSHELNMGAETKVFDLTRPSDDIKTVNFTYKSMPNNSNNDKAHIELYGLK